MIIWNMGLFKNKLMSEYINIIIKVMKSILFIFVKLFLVLRVYMFIKLKIIVVMFKVC